MDRRWLGFLIALMALHSVWALCQMDVPRADDALINAVYGGDSINYGTDLVTPTPPVTVPVERNEALITNPADGTYEVVDLPGKAIDVDKTPLFVRNKSAKGGPFFVAGILDDTLRVAKGDAYDYGYGLKLHDRYEGRVEVNPLTSSTELGEFMSAIIGILSQPRIVNVLRTKDFTVNITCASALCDKRAYSLFTRYMNLGASAQMFTEWIGMGAVNFVIPREWKVKIYTKVRDVKFKLAEKIPNPALRRLLRLPTVDDLLDSALRKLDDQTKNILAEAIGEGGSFNLHRIYINREQTVDLCTYLRTLPPEKRRAFLEAVDGLSVKMERVRKYLDEGKTGEAFEELKGLWEKLALKTEQGEVIVDPVREILAVDIEEGKKRVSTIIKNLSELRNEAAKTLPLTSTLSEVVRGYVGGGVSAKTEKGTALLREWIAPMLYYFIKRGPLTAEQIPGLAAAPGFMSFITFGWRTVGPYPIPAEWRTITLVPAQGFQYGDAFVDFIINKGVDPGDAFKSIVSLTPVCLISTYWEHQQGSAPPFLKDFCVTQRSDRVYEPRTAIVGLGVASPTCPTCSLSIRNNRASLELGGATASAFVLENAPETSGSLAVVFAHHTNIKMGDEAEVDLDEAKEKGETCMQKCPIIRNPVYTLGGLIKDPRGAMFVASWVQSLVYVAPLPIAVLADMALLSPQAQACHACVDDWGGYYIHSYAPYVEEGGGAVPSPEQELSNVVDSVLSSLSLDANSVLAQKLGEFKEYLRSAEVRRATVIANVLLNGMKTGELRFAGILVLWTKAEEMVPTGLHNQESVDVRTPGGTFQVDTATGMLSFNGQPILSGDRVRLYVINNRIPGIIFPDKLVYTAFSGDAFVATSAKDYTFRDQRFISCVTHAFGCQSINDCFGDLVEIHTDAGVIRALDRGLEAQLKETEVASKVRISGYRVYVNVSTFVQEFNKELNAPVIAFKNGIERNAGYLESMIFQNGFIIRDGSRLIVWVETLAAVPGGAVDEVHLDWNADAQGLDVELQPAPDATKEEMDAIEKINKGLDQIGPIRALDSEKVALAIVKDKQGNLWLRIYDKDKNVLRTDLMRDLRELMDTLVALPSTIRTIETNTWLMRIYRDSQGNLRVYFKNKLTGEEWDASLKSVVRDPENPLAVKLITDQGEHELRAFYKDGVPYLSMDGLEGEVTKITGASVRQELIKSISQDPKNPSRLTIETDKGTHTVEIKVARDGTPYLQLDGENKGVLKTIQGTNGFLWFDPTEGWKLVNGALLPLADAFKNGIKISLAADGLVHGEPSSGVVVLSPSQPSQQGLVLPLFEGWEKVFVILSLASLVALFNLRERE